MQIQAISKPAKSGRQNTRRPFFKRVKLLAFLTISNSLHVKDLDSVTAIQPGIPLFGNET